MGADRDHPASEPVERLLADCQVRRVRRSGPGGQNRNKVETGIVLVHRPTGVVAEASERRSQAENRAVALRRLRISLALAVRRPVVPDERPSALWASRCHQGRILVNPGHDDFPALLAEALDGLAACGMDLRSAAARLECTPSQLLKLLKDEPRALLQYNQSRAARGLPELR